MKNVNKLPFIVIVWIFCYPPIVEAESAEQPGGIRWETDYLHALDIANRQKKMLVIVFESPGDPLSQRLQSETLGNADVGQRLKDFVCLRLPLDAKIAQEGKELVLLQDPSLSEMLGRPGVAIADFAPKIRSCTATW